MSITQADQTAVLIASVALTDDAWRPLAEGEHAAEPGAGRRSSHAASVVCVDSAACPGKASSNVAVVTASRRAADEKVQD